MKKTTRIVLIAAAVAALGTVTAVSAAPKTSTTASSPLGSAIVMPSLSVSAPVLKETAAEIQTDTGREAVSAPAVCDASGNHAPGCNGTCPYSAVCDANGNHAYNCNGSCPYSAVCDANGSHAYNCNGSCQYSYSQSSNNGSNSGNGRHHGNGSHNNRHSGRRHH